MSKKELFPIDFCATCNKIFDKNEYRLNCTSCDTYYCEICGKPHQVNTLRHGFDTLDIELEEDFWITEIDCCLDED